MQAVFWLHDLGVPVEPYLYTLNLNPKSLTLEPNPKINPNPNPNTHPNPKLLSLHKP